MTKPIKIMNKTITRKTLIIFSAVVILLALILLALVKSGTDSVPSHKQSTSNNAVTASGKTVDAAELNNDPNTYKGAAIDFTGKVFDVQGSRGDYVLQVYSDADKSDNNIIVYTTDDGTFSEDDYIKVSGIVGGVYEGENAFGAALSVPTVTANSIEKLTADEALAPAKSVVNPKVTKTVGGMAVTLEKVEYADTETRYYIHFNNPTSTEFSYYDFDANLVQSRKKIERIDVYDRGDTDSDSEILANTEQDSKLYFAKVDEASPATLTLEITNNTSYDTSKLSFTIE